MKVLINGALGRMGKELGALLDREGVSHIGADVRAKQGEGVYAALANCQEAVDCIVDFTSHFATEDLISYAEKRRLPLVVATTGQTEEEMAMIRRCSRFVPVLKSANLCLGVALLTHLAREAARALPQADIEIIERHHNQKIDVPSGTALLLADAIASERPGAKTVVGRHENGKREANEIGIHSLRMGGVVGSHEAIFCAAGQQITIRHEAFDRSLFAEGALAAARFVTAHQPGLYSMDDLFR